MSISVFLVSSAAAFKQAHNEPVKPCNMTELDLLPYKAAKRQLSGSGFDLLSMWIMTRTNRVIPNFSEHIA
jgi:hypothetical protein